MSQIISTAALPDGRVAVLAVWGRDEDVNEQEWDQAVQVLASAGVTEGLDFDDAVIVIDDTAELYIASRPVAAAPVTAAEKVTWDRDPHFMRLLDSVCEGSYAESAQ